MRTLNPDMILSRRQRESLLDEMTRMLANKQTVAFANHAKIAEKISNGDLSLYINSPDKEFVIKYSNNTMRFNAKDKTFSELNALIFSNNNKITGITDSGQNSSTISLSAKWAYNKDIETMKRMKKYNPKGVSGAGVVEIVGITDEGKYSEQHLLTYEYWKDNQEKQEEEEQQNYDERYAFKDHQHQQYADKTHLHEQYPTRDELTTLLTTKSDITHDHKDKYLTRDEIIDLIDDETGTPWYETLFKGLEAVHDLGQDGYIYWLQTQVNTIYGILEAQGIIVSTGKLSGIGATVTGVGSKLRSAADVFDAIGNKFNKVKGFTDACSKYLNKGADMLTQFEKIRVQFVKDVGAKVENLGNKFVEYINGHHIGHCASIDEFVANSNRLPNLMEVASNGSMTRTSNVRGLVRYS